MGVGYAYVPDTVELEAITRSILPARNDGTNSTEKTDRFPFLTEQLREYSASKEC